MVADVKGNVFGLNLFLDFFFFFFFFEVHRRQAKTQTFQGKFYRIFQYLF